MVLDVIAREITRRFERAFAILLSLVTLSLSLSLSFFSRGTPLFHLFLSTVSAVCRRRATRLFPLFHGWYPPLPSPLSLSLSLSLPFPLLEAAGRPLWHRREPAFISHLPLFFISDIRIYHRDPGRHSNWRARGGRETNQGPHG